MPLSTRQNVPLGQVGLDDLQSILDIGIVHTPCNRVFFHGCGSTNVDSEPLVGMVAD